MRKLMQLACSLAVLAVAQGAMAQESITVGVTPGTHEKVMEVVKQQAAKDGLDIEIVTFNDYVIPNRALALGDLDANSFQHEPYLDAQIEQHGYDLVAVAKNFIEPMGVYAEDYESLEALPQGGTVAIPNDPSNGGRALLLLEREGLITLREGAGLTAGVSDIADNPKELEFVELDAAQLPRALPDVDAAAINTNYALEADLDPRQDAIAVEDADSPYANIIVVRSEDRNAAWVDTLIQAYQTPEVRQYIRDTFDGAIVPAF
ncbi:MetQ/NlpA family ABC transporter substrate-binding protein [Rhodovibrio salinarum]|uniref:Lipoprotein, YaeC family n=1 Tax=Rhodovibrio salinarum TaxID=1087 RepID=A0A934UZ13_9PROT|nr:MetQ/NlpA family ABC transporter substrate-binding protein [Rhodovibrio salinarum]MBK1696612.1 lipoprotein, YaeC family [Rhodovibrio salinarum]